MSQVNYVKVYDQNKLSEIHRSVTDYLFQRGHTITKPMIDDIATYIYNCVEAASSQIGTITTTYKPLEHFGSTEIKER